MWSWLQQPLLGTGTPEDDYNNVETLNGLEVWRRLSVPNAPRSLAKRYALRDQVNNPKQCTSFAAVVDQLVGWQKTLRAYVGAGAPMPPDEDRRHSLLKMLPPGMSLEQIEKAHTNPTFKDLENWVRLQSEFSQDYGPKRALHAIEAAQPGASQEAAPPEELDEDEEEEELSEEALANMSVSEINAFVRGRQARAAAGGWQQQRRSRSVSKAPRTGGGGGGQQRARSAPGPS